MENLPPDSLIAPMLRLPQVLKKPVTTTLRQYVAPLKGVERGHLPVQPQTSLLAAESLSIALSETVKTTVPKAVDAPCPERTNEKVSPEVTIQRAHSVMSSVDSKRVHIPGTFRQQRELKNLEVLMGCAVLLAICVLVVVLLYYLGLH